MNTTSGTSLQRCQYDRMEKAMFDYIECISDEFFVTVPKGDMEPAIGYFLEAAHKRVHDAFDTVLQQVCRGMGKDH